MSTPPPPMPPQGPYGPPPEGSPYGPGPYGRPPGDDPYAQGRPDFAPPPPPTPPAAPTPPENTPPENTPPGNTPPENGGRGRPVRRRLLSLVGALILVPGTIAGQYWMNARDSAGIRGTEAKVPVVAKGTPGNFAGAAWKLSAVATRAPDANEALEKPPNNTVVVLAAFVVKPGSAKAAEEIDSCRFVAVDDRGREWSTTGGEKFADLDRFADATQDCDYRRNGRSIGPIPPGRAQMVLQAFLVPKEVASTVRFRVGLGFSQNDRELEFAR